MDHLTDALIAMFVFACVYLLVSGGLGAYVGHKKGRPVLEGLLVGLILGPIGVAAFRTLLTLEQTTLAAEDVESEGEEIGHPIAERSKRGLRSDSVMWENAGYKPTSSLIADGRCHSSG
jgi:hypothetical protein